MERTTAEAWSRMFAISMLLGGASGVIAAVFSLLLSPFVTDPELGKAVAIIATIFSSVFILLFSGLFLLLGAGLWNYRSWARITMIVLSWIIGVIAIIIGIVMFFLGMFAVANPTGELSPAMGGLFIAIALVLWVISVFYIWFFQFESTVRELFTTEGGIAMSIDGSHRSVSQAWAINSWVNSVWLAVAGGVALLFGNRFIDFMLTDVAAASQDPEFPQVVEVLNAVQPWIVPVGIGLLVAAALLVFIGFGLWRLQEWARKTVVVLAWILAVAVVIGVIAVPFFAAGVYEAGSNIASLVQYALMAGLQIWFFNLPETKAVFAGVPAKAARRTKR